MMNCKVNQSGIVLLTTLIIASFFLVLAGGLATLGLYRNKLNIQEVAKQQSLHIAEAGVNYYRWHLAHDQDDYMDGTGSDPGGGGEPYGPYVHSYVAPSSAATGKYSLEITPPPTGSTIVRIKSTGWLDSNPKITRTIEVRYGIPSLAHFSFLTNSEVWFGPTETVIGEMHANGGIRMDGTNDSTMASARANYTCPSGQACNTSATCNAPCTWINVPGPADYCDCPGIWGAGPNQSLWTFPVPTVDFNGITMDLADMQDAATSSGAYLNTTGSNKGYHIIFKADGHFDARLVTGLNAALSQYNDAWTGYSNIQESIATEDAAVDYAIPANGVIFVNDGDAWVEGTINGRATVVAATLPDNATKRRSIIINNNLQYLARDGNHSLGLIAQKHVKVPRHAPTNLVIDAIMLAQNGRVFRNYYASRLVKNSIEVYGGILTNQTWTWSWVNGSGTVTDGYTNTTSIYDSNVTYAPPPSFPTTGEYAFISWEED